MLNNLIEIGKRLLAESDIQLVLSVAIDSAIEITGGERGMIILFDQDEGILFKAARNLRKEDITNPKFEISRTIINRVKSTGEPICAENALEDLSLKKSASVERLKILSVICLPLCYKDELFGVVYLDNRTLEGAFEDKTFEFAESFADFISLAAYHALEKKKLSNRVETLEADLRSKYQFEAIIGQHEKMVQILKLVAQVANSDATILIQGESGTGKELIACALHFNSNRREQPFIPINCGALPENLLESELFGHVKGAFTGAIKDKPGWFEQANGGTILLDEVSEMTPALQVKLLRILQTGEFSPVGGTGIRRCDVRMVAATNRDLKKLVHEHKFREDLYYRLNVIDLQIPPLRERLSDIPLLAQHFLAKHNSKGAAKRLSERASSLLMTYDYPGNVRELENAIHRAFTLSESETIEAHHLPPTIYKGEKEFSSSKRPANLTEAKQLAAEKAEQQFAQECLRASHGHIANAAKMAGIDRSNFHKIMNKYHIAAAEFKSRK